MKTSDRSKLMSRAWVIYRATRQSFSDCLKKAWELNRLGNRLHKPGAVRLTYLKKDGSVRPALATLYDTERFLVGDGNRTDNFKTFKYWDLECGAFRCFKVENLLCWE